MVFRNTVRCGVVLVALLAACGGSKKVSSIAVSASQSSLAKGTDGALTAKAIYDDNSVADVTSLASWASSDASLMAVDASSAQSGRCSVKALGVGAVKITASFGGQTGSATMSVTPAVLVEKNALALSPNDVSMHKGNSLTLTLMGLFTDGTHQELTAQAAWSSADDSIASVAGGLVKANQVGSTTIKASIGGQSAGVGVQVGAAELVGISIDQAPIQLIADLTTSLSVTGSFGDGTFENVNALVTWATDNPEVVDVSPDGVLTARSAGTANIRATAGAFSKSLKVTVVAAKLIAVEIEAQHAPLTALPKGLQAQLNAIGKFDNGKTADLTKDAAWTSSDDTIAGVSEGLVTASKIRMGPVVFNATFGGFGGVFRLDVTDAVVTKIAIDPSDLTIPAGLQKQLSATGTLSDDSTRDVTLSASWSTSDDATCSVSNVAASKGLLSAGNAGPCAVTATISEVSGNANVVVSNAALTKVTITPLQNDLKGLPIGLSQRFVAMGTYTAGKPQDITSQVFWSSSDDGIAGISNKAGASGLAFAISEGQTVIKAEDPETHLSNTVTLTVIPAVIIKLDVSCGKASLPKGLTTQCTAMATYSIPGVVLDVTNAVSWSSSAKDAATIDSHGLVIAKDIGTTEITAKDPDSGVESNAFELKVTDAILQRIELEQTLLFERLRQVTMQAAPPGFPVEFKAKGFFSDKPGLAVDITSSVSFSIKPDSACQMSLNFATGLKPGTNCDLTATQDGVSATATLFVLDVVENAMEVAPTPATLAKGTSLNFHAWGIYNLRDPGKTISMAFAFELTSLVSWSTHDIDGTSPVAEISNAPGSQGRVSALHVGRASVQAIDPQSKISGQADLTVTPAVLKSISLAPATAAIHLGQWQQFLVTATFTDDTTQDVTDMASCSTMDAAAAPVPDHSCRFAGVDVGEAMITALFQDRSASAKLVVSEAQLLAIHIQVCDRAIDGSQIVNCHDAASAEVMVGQNAIFRALGFFTDTDLLKGGVPDDVTPFIVWDSSSRDVAHVSNDLRDIGSATGLAVGQSTITAIDPGTLVNARLALTVVPAIQ